VNPSDDPRSPFNWRHPEWKSPIDWSDLQRHARYSQAQTNVVNRARKKNRELSINLPYSEKSAHPIGDPYKFRIK